MVGSPIIGTVESEMRTRLLPPTICRVDIEHCRYQNCNSEFYVHGYHRSLKLIGQHPRRNTKTILMSGGRGRTLSTEPAPTERQSQQLHNFISFGFLHLR